MLYSTVALLLRRDNDDRGCCWWPAGLLSTPTESCGSFCFDTKLYGLSSLTPVSASKRFGMFLQSTGPHDSEILLGSCQAHDAVAALNQSRQQRPGRIL